MAITEKENIKAIYCLKIICSITSQVEEAAAPVGLAFFLPFLIFFHYIVLCALVY